MQTAVEKLLELVPVSGNFGETRVLDVGYGGLEGENTTDAVRARFLNVKGICKDAEAVKRYQEQTGAKDEVTIGYFPYNQPTATFDLIVHDVSIEGNIDFWMGGGMKRTRNFLAEDGHILVYFMTTTDYGDELTKLLLDKFHKTIGFEKLVAINAAPHFQEERRPYITWVLL